MRNPKVGLLWLLVARLIVDGPLSCRVEALARWGTVVMHDELLSRLGCLRG